MHIYIYIYDDDDMSTELPWYLHGLSAQWCGAAAVRSVLMNIFWYRSLEATNDRRRTENCCRRKCFKQRFSAFKAMSSTWYVRKMSCCLRCCWSKQSIIIIIHNSLTSKYIMKLVLMLNTGNRVWIATVWSVCHKDELQYSVVLI